MRSEPIRCGVPCKSGSDIYSAKMGKCRNAVRKVGDKCYKHKQPITHKQAVAQVLAALKK